LKFVYLIAVFTTCLRKHFESFLPGNIKNWRKMMTLKLVYLKSPKNKGLTE